MSSFTLERIEEESEPVQQSQSLSFSSYGDLSTPYMGSTDQLSSSTAIPLPSDPWVTLGTQTQRGFTINHGSAAPIPSAVANASAGGSSSIPQTGKMSDAQFSNFILGAADALDSAPLPQGVQQGSMSARQVVGKILAPVAKVGAAVTLATPMFEQGGALVISSTPGVGVIGQSVPGPLSNLPGAKTISSTLTKLGGTLGGVLGVAGGAFAVWNQAHLLTTGMMPDSTKGKIGFTAQAAISAVAVPMGIGMAASGAASIAAGMGVGAGAFSGAMGAVAGAMSSTAVLAPVAAVLFATTMIVSWMRARDYKKITDTEAVDLVTTGAQYVSNPGKDNSDPAYHQINTVFNNALTTMGISQADMSTGSTRFTAAQRLEIREMIAEKYNIPQVGVCINDLKEVASDAINAAPAGQKQQVFDFFKDQMDQVMAPVIGSSFGNNQDQGIMIKKSSAVSQRDWFRKSLSDLATSVGVSFTANYEDGDPTVHKH